MREITEGIDDTGVKAAFLKCAVERHGVIGDIPRILEAVAIAGTGAWLGCDRFGIEHFNPLQDRIRTLTARSQRDTAPRSTCLTTPRASTTS